MYSSHPFLSAEVGGVSVTTWRSDFIKKEISKTFFFYFPCQNILNISVITKS